MAWKPRVGHWCAGSTGAVTDYGAAGPGEGKKVRQAGKAPLHGEGKSAIAARMTESAAGGRADSKATASTGGKAGKWLMKKQQGRMLETKPTEEVFRTLRKECYCGKAFRAKAPSLRKKDPAIWVVGNGRVHRSEEELLKCCDKQCCFKHFGASWASRKGETVNARERRFVRKDAAGQKATNEVGRASARFGEPRF